MITNIRIERFRGIEDISIGPLAKVNILVGLNGRGKTTILDALSIIGQPDDGVPIIKSGQRRDLPPPSETSDICFKSIFPNLDTARIPRIEVGDDRGNGSIPKILRIEPSWDYVNFGSLPESLPTPTITSGLLVGLTLRYTVGDQPDVVNHIQLSPSRDRTGWLERPIRAAIPERIRSFTIEARNSMNAKATAKVVGDLIKANKLSDLLRMVRPVAPDVVALNPILEGEYPLIWATMNDRSLPANLLGDGFCRLLLIGTGLVSGEQLILADEIDSGLHRSVMESFWQHLATLMTSHHGQMVCATHDEDMLKAAADAFASRPGDLAIFRISKDEHGQGQAIRYSQQELADSFAFGFDIRG